jgi:hypothetical protein
MIMIPKETKMNERIKALWIAELRDGEHEQGRGRLRRETKQGTTQYCCLGILCEIAVREGVIEPPVRHVNDDGTCYEYDLDTDTLPQSVVQWAGLSDSNPVIDLGNLNPETLGGLNDNGSSFAEIAQFIEDKL